MIWGMTLQPGVVYTREVLAVEYLTLASLDCRPGMSAGGSRPMAQLKLQTNDMECILCTLEKGVVHQQILDYVLQDGDNVRFTVEGNSAVYITGYTYRHPVRGDGFHHRGLTSALVRIAPDGLHSDLSPVSSTESESRQPRIIEGTVASVKSEPINVNMEVHQDGTGDQAEPQVEEYLTVTDEDFTEPEEDSLQERPDSESADTSGVQEDTEEESDHQHNRNVSIVSETMTEGAVDDQETDTSVGADASGMKMEIGRRSDVEPQSQLTLSNETVDEGDVYSHGDSEDVEPFVHVRGEQMAEETDKIIREANISCELSNSEIRQEAVACQSSNDEVVYHGTGRETEREGLETMESVSNIEVGVFSVEDEEVTESGDTETVVGSNLNQGDTDTVVGSNQNQGDTETTVGSNQNQGDTETDVGNNQNQGDTDTVIGSNQNQGDAETAVGSNQNQGDAETPVGSNQNLGDAETAVASNQNQGDTETDLGSNKNQGEKQDLVSCKTDLKMRKVTVVLHRIERSTLCSSDERLDDCNDHQDGGKDVLCEGEMGAFNGDIERNVSEEIIFAHPSDIEMANLLLEIHSGEWTIPVKERSADTNMSAVDWKEVRIDGSEKENQSSNESPEISNEEQRPCETRRIQGSDVQSTDSSQKQNESILCVTISPKKGPGSTHLQNETPDGHSSQHTNQKKIQKQLNRKDLNSTMTGRQLRSATTPTKNNEVTSLQGSACNQEKSDPISTPRSIKTKRVLNQRKNITRSEFNTRMKVAHSKRNVYANDGKTVDKKLNSNMSRNGEKSLQCQYCEKKFVYQSYLLRHERSHTGEKPFSCKFCDKKFAMQSNVVAHERIHTGKYPFKCKFCERKFSCISKVKRHENIHTGEELFECQYCDKKFTMKGFLVCHERIHTGEKPFPCKYCEKRFVQKSQMVKHERTHTGEKPFSCRYCEKKFAVKSVLKYHERTHTGEKTFKCEHCGRMFTWRKNWLDHTKIHTGDRPFSCKFCGKRFFQKIILLQHEDTHTGKRRFKCQYCKKRFSWKNNLMRHERRHND